MATDRDEQQRQQRELEEIRRSFAEMGARMGSMFDPTELDEQGSPRPQVSPRPPAPTDRTPLALQGRPRWWWAGALVLVFLAGTAFGWLVPGGGEGADTPTQTTTASPPETVTVPQPPETRVSVPEACLDAAEQADEVIARLTANIRDNRLAAELRDYTISAQACRGEASP
jgi:hypothetical protein